MMSDDDARQRLREWSGRNFDRLKDFIIDRLGPHPDDPEATEFILGSHRLSIAGDAKGDYEFTAYVTALIEMINEVLQRNPGDRSICQPFAETLNAECLRRARHRLGVLADEPIIDDAFVRQALRAVSVNDQIGLLVRVLTVCNIKKDIRCAEMKNDWTRIARVNYFNGGWKQLSVGELKLSQQLWELRQTAKDAPDNWYTGNEIPPYQSVARWLDVAMEREAQSGKEPLDRLVELKEILEQFHQRCPDPSQQRNLFRRITDRIDLVETQARRDEYHQRRSREMSQPFGNAPGSSARSTDGETAVERTDVPSVPENEQDAAVHPFFKEFPDVVQRGAWLLALPRRRDEKFIWRAKGAVGVLKEVVRLLCPTEPHPNVVTSRYFCDTNEEDFTPEQLRRTPITDKHRTTARELVFGADRR